MKNGPYSESLLDMHDNVFRSLMAIRGSQSGEMQFDDFLATFARQLRNAGIQSNLCIWLINKSADFWKNIRMLIFDEVTARVETRSP